MNNAPVIQAFPRRPIGLIEKPGQARRRAIWLVVILLLFIAPLWYGYSVWQRTSLRADLAQRGVSADVVSAEGECLSRRQITGDSPRGCNFDVSYRVRDEHGGGVRQAKLYLRGAAPAAFAPPVIYDPGDPNRAMFAPEVRDGERMMNVAVPIVLFTLVPALGLLGWFAGGRSALAQAAQAPNPTIVAIDRAVRDPRTGRLDIWFDRPDGNGQGLKPFPTGGPLLVAPPPGAAPERQYALALLNAKGWPLLLDQELGELDLTAEERAAVQRAAMG
jgi:hypothetical protein